jgi:hypothetical protein
VIELTSGLRITSIEAVGVRGGQCGVTLVGGQPEMLDVARAKR